MYRGAAICMLVSLCGCDVALGLQAPRRGDGSVSDVAADAIAADMAADAFSPVACPSSYTIMLASTPMSRYRLISAVSTISLLHADCKDDLVGGTHLAAPQTAVEATQIANGVAGSGMRVFVGLVQLPTATTTSADWFVLTGEPVPVEVWDAGEPDDNGGTENGVEQVAFIEPTTRKLRDDNSTKTYYGVCECDGRAVAPNLDPLIP